MGFLLALTSLRISRKQLEEVGREMSYQRLSLPGSGHGTEMSVGLEIRVQAAGRLVTDLGDALEEPQMGEWCVPIPGLGRLASGLSGCIVYML